MGGRGSVPDSPSPSIFAYNVRAGRSLGEGEPGNKATWQARCFDIAAKTHAL